MKCLICGGQCGPYICSQNLDRTSEVSDRLRAEVERARERERAAIVAYLRERANAPHPTEAGERLLSPASRGLVWLMADWIETGEHLGEDR